jgi:hypothetical protein
MRSAALDDNGFPAIHLICIATTNVVSDEKLRDGLQQRILSDDKLMEQLQRKYEQLKAKKKGEQGGHD